MAHTMVEAGRISRIDHGANREAMKGGSLSFHAASLLLPLRTRRASRALYAFCRHADDLVDEGGGAKAVDHLAARLDRIYADAGDLDVTERAFAAVVREFDIPRALPDALIEGFLWDACVRRYETPEDLLHYAARVAGSVGIMMGLVMGVRERATLARAGELGLAMQLTNIARDVGEDARMGRVYLPTRWLAEAGIDPEEFIENPRHTSASGSLVLALLGLADDLYARAAGGIAGLPLSCRPAISAAASIYRAIGSEVAANGFDSVSRRAVTGRGRKVGLLGRAMVAGYWPRPAAAGDVEPCLRHLVESVSSEREGMQTDLDTKMARFIALIAIVEARERGMAAVGAKV